MLGSAKAEPHDSVALQVSWGQVQPAPRTMPSSTACFRSSVSDFVSDFVRLGFRSPTSIRSSSRISTRSCCRQTTSCRRILPDEPPLVDLARARVVGDVQPRPLNWMAGDDEQLLHGAAALRAGLDRRIGKLLDHLEAVTARFALVFVEGHRVLMLAGARIADSRCCRPSSPKHQPAQRPERRRALGQQRVVKRAQRRLAALLLLPVVTQLEQRQLAGGVDQIGRIERAALGLAPGARLPRETPRRGRSACPAPPTSHRCADECRRRSARAGRATRRAARA